MKSATMGANIFKAILVFLALLIVPKFFLVKSFNAIDEELPPSFYKVFDVEFYVERNMTYDGGINIKTEGLGKYVILGFGYEYQNIPYIVLISLLYNTTTPSLLLEIYNVRGEKLTTFNITEKFDITDVYTAAYGGYYMPDGRFVFSIPYINYQTKEAFVLYFVFQGKNIVDFGIVPVGTLDITREHISKTRNGIFVYINPITNSKIVVFSKSEYASQTHYLKILEVSDNITVFFEKEVVNFEIIPTKDYIYFLYVEKVGTKASYVIYKIDKLTGESFVIYNVTGNHITVTPFIDLLLGVDYENNRVAVYGFDNTTQRILLIYGDKVFAYPERDVSVVITRYVMFYNNYSILFIGDKEPEGRVYKIELIDNSVNFVYIGSARPIYNLTEYANVTFQVRYSFDREYKYDIKALGATRKYTIRLVEYLLQSEAFREGNKTKFYSATIPIAFTILFENETLKKDIDILPTDTEFILMEWITVDGSSIYRYEAYLNDIKYLEVPNNFVILLYKYYYNSTRKVTYYEGIEDGFVEIYIVSVLSPTELPSETPEIQPPKAPIRKQPQIVARPPTRVFEEEVERNVTNITPPEVEYPTGVQAVIPLDRETILLIIMLIIVLFLIYYISRQ